MAIVDVKHTQTIEEMLRDGGGSGGEIVSKFVPLICYTAINDGGFVKEYTGIHDTNVYYTFDEMRELLVSSKGMLFAIDISPSDNCSDTISRITLGANTIKATVTRFYSLIESDTMLYFTNYTVELDATGYTFSRHDWTVDVTNDD